MENPILEQNTSSDYTDYTHQDNVDELWIEEALATLRVREAVLELANGPERADWERTKANKARFLELFEKTMGTITVSCAEAGIERKTFYNWMDNDPHFRSAVNEIRENRGDQVEDRLMKLIQEGDPSSTRFYLDRRVKRYQKRTKLDIDVSVGHRTLEEQLYDIAKKRKAEAEAQIIGNNVPQIRDAEVK